MWVSMFIKTATVLSLLVLSNVLMTFAWYWHIKPGNAMMPMWKIVLISWCIALFEYCLAVPANHYGAAWGIRPFQLKIMQEVITLTVFALFAVFYLKEGFKLNYLISFGFILWAVYFAPPFDEFWQQLRDPAPWAKLKLGLWPELIKNWLNWNLRLTHQVQR